MTEHTDSLENGEIFSLRATLSSVLEKNERLSRGLQEARQRITDLNAQVERLSQPPGSIATFISANHDRREILAMVNGRQMILAVSHLIDLGSIRPGQELILNESLVVIGTQSYDRIGSLATVALVIDSERVVVRYGADDERVMRLSGRLMDRGVRLGDTVLADMKAGYVLEHVERPDVEHLLLEEIPDVTYADIGGLDAQIEQIRDSIELPFEHPQLYREHGLKPPKGVLLYGPPGTGKTLIAKAVATSIAEKVAQRNQAAASEDPAKSKTQLSRYAHQPRSYFFNIKGPQLLDKYVGETERQIRQIFARARDRAASGIPVVIFFDEMEALFRTRGSGVSSDVETTIVPQLLTEIDGVEQLDNVIVIGASNREDMIDPAILRPGRFDAKIRIDRPTRSGAREIILKYLTPDLPIHLAEINRCGSAAAAVETMAREAVDMLFERTTQMEFVELTYVNGQRERLYVCDFVSGAMLAAIVDRAKKYAIKDFLQSGQRGISMTHIRAAIYDEVKQNDEITQLTNPQEWARIHGRHTPWPVANVRPICASSEILSSPSQEEQQAALGDVPGENVGEYPSEAEREQS
ncbi:proteasome ATPase [Trueperella sp. LYQ143]|uniref:proteasome ATPase n=1 Tax=unclassified Trueperella TaxID=2630174 RepID=UPI003983B7BD